MPSNRVWVMMNMYGALMGVCVSCLCLGVQCDFQGVESSWKDYVKSLNQDVEIIGYKCTWCIR